MKPVVVRRALLALAAIPPFAFAQADNFPVKPIRVIVPFPTGGSVDLAARLVGAKLSQVIGQQVVLDNRSGASGNIGMELLAKSAPDGYTIGINTLPFITNGFLYSRVPYDVINDFTPVSLMSASSSVITVHPSVPAKSIKELIALAKSKPGQLNYGSAGVGTNPHISGELFNLLAKTNIVAVQFKGGGPALIAAVAGDVSITSTGISETLPYIESRRLRPLGVTTLKRSHALPDVPAIAETLPGYEFTTWQMILAPKATPRAIVNVLNQRITQVLREPEFAKAYEARTFEIVASAPDEAAAYLKNELTKWGRVIKERGMRAE